MSLRMFAHACALLGGLAWVVRWALSVADVGRATLDASYWGGLVLLAVGVLVGAASLVSSTTPWLRLVVAVAALLLGWSALVIVQDQAGAPGPALEGVVGVVVALVWAPALWRAATWTPEAEDAAVG